MVQDRILLVDDEEDITSLIKEALQQEGFLNIQTVHTGRDAIEIAKEQRPELIVLDVMLPDFDGIEVCRQLRSFTYCPILFLSARSDEVDKMIGLGCGGDDYVTKPFSVKELVFRIKAQLRRQQYSQQKNMIVGELLTVSGVVLEPDTFQVTRNGENIELTAREFQMLQYMMEHKGMILSKERIYEAVWGEMGVVCDNTIMVHIRHLREKLEKNPSQPTKILTVKGLGYKFVDGDK